MIRPLLGIKNGSPAFLTPPPNFEPGFNRSDSMSMLNEAGDWPVLVEYLTQFQDRPNTLANYLKEVERFALWLIHEKQKPLSAVNRADWLSYLEFIKSPPANWCSTKQRKSLDADLKIINEHWRPFEIRKEHQPLARTGNTSSMPDIVVGLSKSSQDLAKRIIEAMYTFLVVAGHLNANPAMSPRTRNRASVIRKSFNDRSISDDLVDFTVDSTYQAQLAARTEQGTFKWLRARYIVQLFAATGMRLSEAAQHSYGCMAITKTDKWTLNIIGKGENPRSIEVFDDLKAVMKEFRQAMGCHLTPLYNDSMYLVPSAKPNKAISSRRIIQIMREAFDLASTNKQRLAGETTNPDDKGLLLRDASILENASAHWLRHAHATYYLKMTNNNLKATMQRMGHSDPSTTLIYIHTDD